MNRRWVRTVVILCALVLSSFCFLYGFLHRVPNAVYTGLRSINASDINQHMSWIGQSRRGRFLLKNEFTAEPHAGLSVRPSYFVLSLPFAFSSLSNAVVYHVERVFCGLLLLLALFPMLRSLTRKERPADLAFLLLVFTSGFGFLVRRWLPESADLSIPESNLFTSLGDGPHFLFSLFFLWGGVVSFYRAAGGARNGLWLCFGCLFLLWWDHPFDAVILVAVCGANLWALPDHRARAMFVAGAGVLSVPPFLYYQYLKTQPAFSGWGSAQNLMLSPSLLSLLCGFAPLLILGIPGALKLREDPEKRKLLYFLLFWIASQFILAYLPFPFQRRLIAGVQLPLALLAAYGLERLRSPAAIVAILVVASAGSFFMMRDQVRDIRSNGMPFYLPVPYKEAFDWMNAQEHKGSVLSGFVTGNFIPPYTGFQSYVGHSSLTPNVAAKRRLLEAFYRNPADAFLRENGFQYIFFGAEEYRLSGGRKLQELFHPVYARDGIYLLDPHRRDQ